MFFFQKSLQLFLFLVPNKNALHNTGVCTLTSITDFSRLKFLTWTHLFNWSCAKAYKEIQVWNAKQEDGGWTGCLMLSWKVNFSTWYSVYYLAVVFKVADFWQLHGVSEATACNCNRAGMILSEVGTSNKLRWNKQAICFTKTGFDSKVKLSVTMWCPWRYSSVLFTLYWSWYILEWSPILSAKVFS